MYMKVSISTSRQTLRFNKKFEFDIRVNPEILIKKFKFVLKKRKSYVLFVNYSWEF